MCLLFIQKVYEILQTTITDGGVERYASMTINHLTDTASPPARPVNFFECLPRGYMVVSGGGGDDSGSILHKGTGNWYMGQER